MLSLHYLVKCRSRSLTIDNNEFILGSACINSNYSDHKSLKICYFVFTLKILSQQTEIIHQHLVGRLSHPISKWCQRLPLAFVLQEDIFSICCNEDDVM